MFETKNTDKNYNLLIFNHQAISSRCFLVKSLFLGEYKAINVVKQVHVAV